MVEVYNDVNRNLVNLFRCVKYHADALYEELKWLFISREQFEQAKEDVNNPNLTDIQRAARFFILVKCSFGAKMQDFSGKRVSFSRTIDDLGLFKERLRATVIEQLDFEKLITLYDREGTLFYADPPYYEAEGYYAEEFLTEKDHVRLKKALEKIKGKFILSYNDCEYIRDLYVDYTIIEVERLHNLISGKTKPRYKELLIKNY